MKQELECDDSWLNSSNWYVEDEVIDSDFVVELSRFIIHNIGKRITIDISVEENSH